MPRIPSTPAVLVVAPEISDGFMRDDLRIIHQFAQVVTLETSRTPARGGRVLGRAFRLAANFALFLFRMARYRPVAVVFWFATTNYAPVMAMIARLLGARVVVITGGNDAVYVPDMRWGELGNPWHRRTFGWLMRRADAVLPFSDSARREIEKDFRTRRMVTAYPAVDTRFFVPSDAPPQRRVVTCCYAYDEARLVQKGIAQFADAARLLPDVEFVLVGDPVDDAARAFVRDLPANVHALPRIRRREGYRDLLASSSVYVQLSAHEGFGVSVAEAMACGCVPVVADRYSLPEVEAGTGHVVPFGDAPAAAAAIRQAVAAPAQARSAARARVLREFTSEHRANQLFEEMARLVPALRSQPVRVELGCGSTGVAGTVGVDMRRTPQTRAVCDVRHSCFRTGIADEVFSFCVLEHLDDPYELLDEVVRVLKPDGRAYLRVPNLGTYSAHLDTTHRFLADLQIWRGMMRGYFERVTVVPAGLKYRANPVLKGLNWVAVHVFRWHELAQGWTFVCERKRAEPSRYYMGWWQEPPAAPEDAILMLKAQGRAGAPSPRDTPAAPLAEGGTAA